MSLQWQSLSDKFSNLSVREKWLITLCGTIGLLMVLFTLLLEPKLKALSASESKLQATQESIQKSQNDLLVLQAKLSRNPDKDIDIRLEELTLQSQDLSMALSEIIDGLIAPAQMAELLENVLASGVGLKLISLESLDPESIISNQEKKATDEEAGESLEYFLHPVKMELTGDYFAITQYLKALEALPVSYYWRSFQYTVEEYPQARLVFEVYTLGTRQEFIGG